MSLGEKKSFSDLVRYEKERYGITPTLNKMGYMTEKLNPYTLSYLKFLESTPAPTFDIGVAYGATSVEALKKGKIVIANDVCEEHLQILRRNVPSKYLDNLTTITGKFPQEISLEANSLGAVLASRVFHFLKGTEIERGLEKIHNWLVPGGKVFIIAETVYKKLFRRFIPVYERRKCDGILWPGETDQLQQYASGRTEHLPSFINFLDNEVLERSLTRAGFIVEESSMFSKESLPEDARLGGKETVGIIGLKP